MSGESTVGPIQHPNWDLTQLGKWVGSIEVILSATNYKSPGGGGVLCVGFSFLFQLSPGWVIEGSVDHSPCTVRKFN